MYKTLADFYEGKADAFLAQHVIHIGTGILKLSSSLLPYFRNLVWLK